jgi:hypothetical protein
MAPSRRTVLAVAVVAVASLTAGCASPTPPLEFSREYDLVTVNGQPTPVVLATQHVEILTGGGLIIDPNGTGDLTYVLLPIVADTSHTVVNDPFGSGSVFTWTRTSHSHLVLNCPEAGLGKLDLVIQSDGSLLLTNLGATWRFVPQKS